MNKRQKKKQREHKRKRMMHVMIYNRSRIEWAYAKYIPWFKSLRNYQKAIKYRLKQHMKYGYPYLLYYHRDKPVKNFDYLRDALCAWVEPRQCELSAKHLLYEWTNDELKYLARYNMITSWKLEQYISFPDEIIKRVPSKREDKFMENFLRKKGDC